MTAMMMIMIVMIMVMTIHFMSNSPFNIHKKIYYHFCEENVSKDSALEAELP